MGDPEEKSLRSDRTVTKQIWLECLFVASPSSDPSLGDGEFYICPINQHRVGSRRRLYWQIGPILMYTYVIHLIYTYVLIM